MENMYPAIEDNSVSTQLSAPLLMNLNTSNLQVGILLINEISPL